MKIKTKKKLDHLEETKNLIRSAIEAKGQSVSDLDTFRSYADKISSIESAAEPVVQPLNVTANGEYPVPDGVDGFAPVTVNVPDIPAVIHPLSITENGTYTAPANVDGYNPIVVEVPSEEPVLQDKEITENGSYSADAGFDGLGTVTVNIPDPTKTVILAEQEIPGFAYVEDSGLSLYMLPTLSPAPFILNDGETYYVRWDGTEYECVASIVEGVVLIGNGGIIGLPSTGEPFAALYDPTRNALDVVTSQEGESHTVGIWQKVSQEIKLQDKTITENGEYTADSGFDGLGKVIVDVLQNASSGKLQYKSFYCSAQSVLGFKVEVDFGFKPDIILLYLGAGSIGNKPTSCALFYLGASQAFEANVASRSMQIGYLSASGTYYTNGTGYNIDDPYNQDIPISGANETGFYLGDIKPYADYYYGFAIGGLS